MSQNIDFQNYLQQLEAILSQWVPETNGDFPDFKKFSIRQNGMQEKSGNFESVSIKGNLPDGPVQTREKIQELEKTGDRALLQGRFPEALAAFNLALELDEKVADAQTQAGLKFKTGKIQVEFGRWEIANLLFHESQHFFETNDNHASLTRIRLEKARMALKKGQYASAQNMLENALNTAQHLHDVTLIHAVCLQFGVMYQILNSPKFALAYFEEGLRAAQMTVEPRETADAYFHLGVFYQSRQDTEKATAHLMVSKRLCEQHDFLYPLGFIWWQEAALALEDEHLPAAREALEKALPIFIQSQNQLGAARCVQLMGKLAAKINSWETSQKFFELAIEIFQNFEIPYDLALCCVNYADQLLEKEQISSATRHYQMAANLYRELRLEELYVNLEEEIAVLSRFSDENITLLPY
jgi:tetratricopeptide (TPR) repeat protein